MIRTNLSEIVKIPVEDIYRDENNPRSEFAGIPELAAKIKLIGLMHPVIVRRYGDIYKLVQGERRWLAHKHLGWTEIEARVAETDEEESLLYELGGNDQQPLSASEVEHGVQRALFFDRPLALDDLAVVAGIPADRMERIARGSQSTGDPTLCEDYPFAWSEALDELSGDAEAYAAVKYAKPAEWQKVYNDFARARKADAALAEAKALIEAAGCTFTDKHPEGFKRIAQGRERPEGATVASAYVVPWDATVEIWWYAPIGAETEAERAVREEREAKTAAREAEVAKRESNKARRLACVKEAMNPLSPHTHAVKKFAQQLWESGVLAKADNIPEALADVDGFTARVHAAVLGHVESNAGILFEAESVNRDYYNSQYGQTTVAYFDFLKKCGHELSASEAERLAEVKRALKKKGSDE